MAKVTLSDRFIASPQRVPAQGRVDLMDALVPGLALRVTAKGHRSFVMITRFPLNPKNPTRRTLGDCFMPPRDHDPGRHAPVVPLQGGALTLGEAREKARSWLALIQRGIDPKIEEARQRAAEQRKQVNTFAAVATQFLERVVKGAAYVELERLAGEYRTRDRQITAKAAFNAVCSDSSNVALARKMRSEGIAKKDEAIRALQGDFVKRWGHRPATDILPEECAAAIRAVAKRAPYEAHNRLGHLRRLFNWAIGTHEFGITVSPVERLSPKDLIGKREPRERILTDTELVAVWQATNGPSDVTEIMEARRRDTKKETGKPLGYPYGPLVRLLVLTGLREREVGDMSWAEVNFETKLWTIPARRMKGGRAHEVPLTPMAIALLRDLPRFNGGDYVFTTTSGQKPVSGYSKTKERLDLVSGVSAWRFHDLRRTMRTHLSALPVQDLVRELVIAHAKPGLHKVYDLHAYQDEKRECLELWEERLSAILSRKPSTTAR